MKKISWLIIAIVFMSIFMTSFAESTKDEISFLDIPWMSDIKMVEKKLSENSAYIKSDDLFSQMENNGTYIIEDDVTLFRPYSLDQFAAYIFSISPKMTGKIGGYPVKRISCSFAYDGEMKLISVTIELINSDYQDLQKKLSYKYGESISNITEEGIETHIWKGDNNSAVILYSESSGINYTLMYGRLDAVEILQNCSAPADPDDVSGL